MVFFALPYSFQVLRCVAAGFAKLIQKPAQSDQLCSVFEVRMGGLHIGHVDS
jgi:hypothetical protein